MDFRLETTSGALKAALNMMRPVMAGRTTIPILGMLRVTCRDGAAWITGTDLDMELQLALPAAMARGDALLPYRLLARVAPFLGTGEKVVLTGLESGVEMRAGRMRLVLPTMEVSDFPDFTVAEPRDIEIDGAELRRALGFTLAFASREETRYYLNGVCLRRGHAVATDGHRCAVTPFHIDLSGVESAGEAMPIIPINAATLMARLPDATRMGFDAKATRIRIAFPGGALAAKLIDGPFPDIDRVIPDTAGHRSVTVDRLALLGVVRRLNAASSMRTGMGLACDGRRLAMALCEHAEAGPLSAAEAIDVAEGTPFEVMFNGRYLQQVISATRGETVRLFVPPAESIGDRPPAVYAPMTVCGERDGEKIVIMPMRDDHRETDLARAALADDGEAGDIEWAA